MTTLYNARITALIALTLLFAVPAGGQTPGKDGNKTVNATEIVNIYTRLTADAASSSLNLSVMSNAGFSAGDLMMIYQAQGATISTINDATYGAVTSYNNAGRYELVGVASVTGTTVITASLPLSHSYTASGNVQVVRVPQYSKLRVNSGGMITAEAWDGQTGGIVAIHVSGGTTIIEGSIDASGKGFRGGALTVNGPSSGDYAVYRSTSATDGAEKGEGIAGPSSALADGAYGRGAPANGGGGGNTHNAGGGGGSNASNGAAWTGQGVMCTSCTGTAAWALDSAYILNGNTYTSSSGGGRGGYTFSMGDQNALTLEPGNATWAGNYRRERGGLGGHSLAVEPCTRVYFGGGGGAGNANNASGGAGGNGGGIVVLMGSSISGAGSITSHGSNGANTTNTHNDAPGGGGAGGTVIVSGSSVITGVSMAANGGNGGNQLITSAEAEGPGGGGGGGCVITSYTTSTRTASGGSNGTSSSSAITEFPANGSTSGNSGAVYTELCPSLLPVELTSFVARNRKNVIVLEWHTATELNNFGFEIERRMQGGPWDVIGFVDGAGTTNAPKSYSFEDKSSAVRASAGTIEYRLLQIDRDGALHYSPAVSVDLYGAATAIELSIAPNPIRNSASVHVNIVHTDVYSLSVYNLAGARVASLAQDQTFEQGNYAIPFAVDDIPAGSYLIVLQSDTDIATYGFTKLR